MLNIMKLVELLGLGKHQSNHANFMTPVGRNGLIIYTRLKETRVWIYQKSILIYFIHLSA